MAKLKIPPLLSPAQVMEATFKSLGVQFSSSGTGELQFAGDTVKNPEKLLATINKMLAFQRQYARDHNTGLQADPDKTSYQGASIVRAYGLDRNNQPVERFFINNNIHLTNNSTGRQCAEERSIASALRELKPIPGQPLIKEIWYMGGESKVSPKVEISSKKIKAAIAKTEHGAYYSPCGSCRDIITTHGNPETLVHVLPLNDGTLALQRDTASPEVPHDRPSDGKTVWTQRAKFLLPFREMRAEYKGADQDLQAAAKFLRLNKRDKVKHLNEKATSLKWSKQDTRKEKSFQYGDALIAMRLALGLAEDGQPSRQDQELRLATFQDKLQAIEQTPEDALSVTEKHTAIEHVIHEFMMEYAREQHAEHAKDNIKRISIAVVRMVDEHGVPRYRVGRHLAIEGVQSNSSATREAVDKLIKGEKNATATDVFCMQIDSHLFDKSVTENENPLILGPDGDQMDTFLKASRRNLVRKNGVVVRNYDGEAMGEGQPGQAMVHVMMPCDPKRFNPDRHIIRKPLAEMMPYAFTGRPRLFVDRCGHDHGSVGHSHG